MPPCSRPSRTRPSRAAPKNAPSLTAAARVGFGILRSGRKKAGRTKERGQESEERKKRSCCGPLDKKSPIQAVCINMHVRIEAGGEEQSSFLPRPHIPASVAAAARMIWVRNSCNATNGTRVVIASYFGGTGMAEEWWSTISHWSPFLTYVKL